MDQQRALLDELMGVSRDGERQEYISFLYSKHTGVKRKFSDDDVCKFYIQGFCFMEEFQRTKHNYGDCDKVHDDDCKAQWQALKDEEKMRYPYEKELWTWLEKMMSDLRAKVKRNQERIDNTGEVPLMTSDQSKLTEIDAEIKKLVRQSEELGEEGNVDAAQAAATQADRLKTEKVAFEAEAKQKAQDSLNRYGEQEVCQYSGVIINNEESRIRDHKAGRNYRAWVNAHEKRKEMEETFKKRGGLPRSSSYGRERARESHRDRHHDRERHYDRDRSHESRRDRDRDDHRDRDRYRSRERSRERRRSKDRDRLRAH